MFYKYPDKIRSTFDTSSLLFDDSSVVAILIPEDLSDYENASLISETLDEKKGEVKVTVYNIPLKNYGHKLLLSQSEKMFPHANYAELKIENILNQCNFTQDSRLFAVRSSKSGDEITQAIAAQLELLNGSCIHKRKPSLFDVSDDFDDDALTRFEVAAKIFRSLCNLNIDNKEIKRNATKIKLDNSPGCSIS